MKTIQLIIIALLVSSFCAAQKAYSSKKAIITGTIWVSPNDTLTITYYPYKLGDTRIGGIITRHAHPDGHFRLEIENMEHPYYFSIESVKQRGILLNKQLIEPGDSLVIISDKEVILNRNNAKQSFFSITGRNADKNQLLDFFEFAMRRFKISGLIVSIINKYSNLREALTVEQKNSERYKAYLDSLVTAHHFSIPDKTKEQLLLDLKIRGINGLISVYGHLRDKYTTGKEASATALQELQNDYKEIVNPMVKKLIQDYTYPAISPDFADMATRKTLIDTRIQQGDEQQISGVQYLDVLQQWPISYREQITTTLMAYLYTYGYNVKKLPDMYPVLSSRITTPGLRYIIQNFEQLYVPGKTVPSFQLTGMNDETVRISDYKNKIIVLDFWFTGCTACVQMARVLKIIKKRLEYEEDIVFMSVSIDKNKETWLKSVAAEIYTHADFINVYTGGDAMDHPLIKHYSVTAYPRVLIIGKNNKLFTANPHMPRNYDEIELLIQDILDAKK